MKKYYIQFAYLNETEAKLITNSTKYYLKTLQEELKGIINRLDSYIVEN